MTYTPPPNGFRTFTIVWLTQSLSVIGGAMMGFALNVYLVQGLYPEPGQRAELALALTALNLALFVPVVFGAPLAGAFADRHDRKRTMIAADLLNGVVCLLIIVLMLQGVLQLWMLICTGVVSALAGAFHYAAFDASYAMLVSDRLLPRANGMMQTTWWSSGIVAPGLAALVITLPTLVLPGVSLDAPLAAISNGVALCIAVNALTFVVSAAVLLIVRIPSPQRSDVGAGGELETSIWSDIREGILYIWHRRPLLWLLGTFTLANFVGGTGSVITPLLVKFNLAADWMGRGFNYEAALALVGTLSGIGGVVGGVLMSTWGGLKRKRIYGVLIPMLCTVVADIVFGLTPLLFVAAAAALTFSVMSPLLNAHSQTIWQTQTPRELQGRVFSVRRLIAQCSLPVGAISAGSLAGVFDPGHVLAGLGLLLALFCLAQLFNPYLLRVEDKAWLDRLAASRQ
jgi:DHA3 family macrolide efflux protein-like MFS transporter